MPVLAGFSLFLCDPLASAQAIKELQAEGNKINLATKQTQSLDSRPINRYDSYILGPGDALYIELLELPELSGRFAIGPDGTLYLPRLRAFYAEGLTVEELRDQLTKEFNAYVRDPQVYVRPVTYRPVRIYVGGEVKRPGYYTLTGVQSPFDEVNAKTSQFDSNIASPQTKLTQQSSIAGGTSKGTLFPTVFDAIRSAQGITPYSDLTKVEVTRKRAQGLGGGNIRTTLDFLSLITEGNESQNIRLFDSDVVIVKKAI